MSSSTIPDRADHYFVASDGAKVHWVSAGSGVPVVLIHGAGSRAERWFANGLAPTLARTNRVIVPDMRGHGESDAADAASFEKMPSDVIEILDSLGVAKAHVGGYSMGGMITARLLATHPERFITAFFGGSGIRETPEWAERVPPDREGAAPDEEAARAARAAGGISEGVPARSPEGAQRPGRPVLDIDLTTIHFPVLAVNGEYDRPYQKTHRLWRELSNFTNVVLAGKGHLSAIVEGYMPSDFESALVGFITANNP
ncbi:MAG TPA: alpha/beta hydrolase [Acidimicrobiales bacterium]|nr:alpha/beta hydrolase [Acidimicrobiales bacterium]